MADSASQDVDARVYIPRRRAARTHPELSEAGGENAAMEELRHARHNLLGRLNGIKMCVSALESVKPHEAIEFLEMIETATDRAIAAMDAFEEAFDRDPEAASKLVSKR